MSLGRTLQEVSSGARTGRESTTGNDPLQSAGGTALDRMVADDASIGRPASDTLLFEALCEPAYSRLWGEPGSGDLIHALHGQAFAGDGDAKEVLGDLQVAETMLDALASRIERMVAKEEIDADRANQWRSKIAQTRAHMRGPLLKSYLKLLKPAWEKPYSKHATRHCYFPAGNSLRKVMLKEGAEFERLVRTLAMEMGGVDGHRVNEHWQKYLYDVIYREVTLPGIATFKGCDLNKATEYVDRAALLQYRETCGHLESAGMIDALFLLSVHVGQALRVFKDVGAKEGGGARDPTPAPHPMRAAEARLPQAPAGSAVRCGGAHIHFCGNTFNLHLGDAVTPEGAAAAEALLEQVRQIFNAMLESVQSGASGGCRAEPACCGVNAPGANTTPMPASDDSGTGEARRAMRRPSEAGSVVSVFSTPAEEERNGRSSPSRMSPVPHAQGVPEAMQEGISQQATLHANDTLPPATPRAESQAPYVVGGRASPAFSETDSDGNDTVRSFRMPRAKLRIGNRIVDTQTPARTWDPVTPEDARHSHPHLRWQETPKNHLDHKRYSNVWDQIPVDDHPQVAHETVARPSVISRVSSPVSDAAGGRASPTPSVAASDGGESTESFRQRRPTVGIGERIVNMLRPAKTGAPVATDDLRSPHPSLRSPEPSEFDVNPERYSTAGSQAASAGESEALPDCDAESVVSTHAPPSVLPPSTTPATSPVVTVRPWAEVAAENQGKDHFTQPGFNSSPRRASPTPRYPVDGDSMLVATNMGRRLDLYQTHIRAANG